MTIWYYHITTYQKGVIGMIWNIPGTVLTAAEKDGALVESQFRAMFLPGGMVLSQVSAITGLESYIIQNWVKRGFLTKPDNKQHKKTSLSAFKGCYPIPHAFSKSITPVKTIKKPKLKAENSRIYCRDFCGA